MLLIWTHHEAVWLCLLPTVTCSWDKSHHMKSCTSYSPSSRDTSSAVNTRHRSSTEGCSSGTSRGGELSVCVTLQIICGSLQTSWCHFPRLSLTNKEESLWAAAISGGGLSCGQCDLLKIFISNTFWVISQGRLCYFCCASCSSSTSPSLFLSSFLSKLVAGGHPAAPLSNYIIIIGQNETRTSRSCAATWLAELPGWDRHILHVCFGVWISWSHCAFIHMLLENTTGVTSRAWTELFDAVVVAAVSSVC